MPKKRVLSPKSIWDVEEVKSAFHEANIKEIHLYKLYQCLAKNPDVRWKDITFLPKNAVRILEEQFLPLTSTCVKCSSSSDRETYKLLIRLQDGFQVESVLMTYDTSTRDVTGQTGGVRSTLCVSSEVGCQMGCTFCATGTMGLKADLTAGEIVEQVVHARKASANLRNVVFMGMGEPLNNYNAVKSAISLMINPNVFGFRQKCVTLSTVGVIPRIIQLAHDLPGISLALSLHASNQDLRQKIVPSGRAYKLDRLMASIDTYQAITKGKVFIEYVLLGPDVNCTSSHARELGELLKGRDVVINIIPWNPILSPGMPFEAPGETSIRDFLRILKDEYRLPGTIRQEKGQDVSAACGQLVLLESKKCSTSTTVGYQSQVTKDLEDLVAR